MRPTRALAVCTAALALGATGIAGAAGYRTTNPTGDHSTARTAHGPIKSGTVYSTVGVGRDWYVLHVPSTRAVRVRITNLTPIADADPAPPGSCKDEFSCPVQVEFRAPDGEQLGWTDANAGGESETLVRTLPRGTFYLRVSGGFIPSYAMNGERYAIRATGGFLRQAAQAVARTVRAMPAEATRVQGNSFSVT